MSVEIDIKSWEKQFNLGVEIVVKNHRSILKAAVQEFLEEVKERTPIGHPWEWQNPPARDYVPGALRQAWATEQLGQFDFVVYNDRLYAYRIETGWSKQAPMGMMRLTALDFPLIMQRTAAKYKMK